MTDDGRGWLLRYHPYGYGLLTLLFAVPALIGLLSAWPDLAALPGTFPGHWGTVALFSTLIAAGMSLRTVTPAANLVDLADDRAK